ncbi:MAG: CocE/NonD family hydrolase [Firmicutes bacterium]|nr:CocE/NonD family hydrolase [Bacillota bacterium]
MSERKIKKELRTFGNETIEVLYRKALPPEESGGRFPELNPGTSVEDGIINERDVGVTLRDGTVIYVDIFRPEGAEGIPAIVAWGPFGKRAGGGDHEIPGIPKPSKMTMFEGPDPEYWCRHGYAVVNVDIRGIGNSEGDMQHWGSQDGKDGYDVVEWLAAREWCNGRIGFSGNSWLAISQWFIAAERPPHLAAIAPWEGHSDMYRDDLSIGGVVETGFSDRSILDRVGRNYIEDVANMIHQYPLMNSFWEDKIPRFENIDVPAYIVASWTNPIHTLGTFRAFCNIRSTEKWLRVHNTQEWVDYADPESREDLRRFFDRYLKGIENGWEETPRVRLSILDPGGRDIVNRPEKEFPLLRTEYVKLYLDASTGLLSPGPVAKESKARYRSDDEQGKATFTIRFTEDTELTGFMKLRLWVEADGADDMDLFVYVEKLDEQGNLLSPMVLGHPCPGAQGMLRVSHRELDEEKSTPYKPYLSHRQEQLLHDGEIVPVDIEIWPMGMIWHKGQQLRLTIQGFGKSWMDDLLPGIKMFNYHLRNRGDHIIHTGGKYESYLLVPKIS